MCHLPELKLGFISQSAELCHWLAGLGCGSEQHWHFDGRCLQISELHSGQMTPWSRPDIHHSNNPRRRVFSKCRAFPGSISWPVLLLSRSGIPRDYKTIVLSIPHKLKTTGWKFCKLSVTNDDSITLRAGTRLHAIHTHPCASETSENEKIQRLCCLPPAALGPPLPLAGPALPQANQWAW